MVVTGIQKEHVVDKSKHEIGIPIFWVVISKSVIMPVVIDIWGFTSIMWLWSVDGSNCLFAFAYILKSSSLFWICHFGTLFICQRGEMIATSKLKKKKWGKVIPEYY